MRSPAVPAYPADITITPKRRRSWTLIALLLLAAGAMAMLIFQPKAQPLAPARTAQAVPAHTVMHHPAPARSAVTVTVGKTTYACTVAQK
jgi:hypothetical protein